RDRRTVRTLPVEMTSASLHDGTTRNTSEAARVAAARSDSRIPDRRSVVVACAFASVQTDKPTLSHGDAATAMLYISCARLDVHRGPSNISSSDGMAETTRRTSHRLFRSLVRSFMIVLCLGLFERQDEHLRAGAWTLRPILVLHLDDLQEFAACITSRIADARCDPPVNQVRHQRAH